MIKAEETLLSRDQSNFIKGILILLIVLGHNSILMHIVPDSPLKNWIYSFHVKSFFFLPFLYGFKEFRLGSLKKNSRRLLLPYTIFFIMLFIANIHDIQTVNLYKIAWTYITGSNDLLRSVTGLTYLWFLPSMFSILAFRDLSFSYKPVKWVLLILGISLLTGLVSLLISPRFSVFFPLGIFSALINFPLAIFFRLYFERNNNMKLNVIIWSTLACFTTFCWFVYSPVRYYWCMFFYIILPMTIFPFLFYFAKSFNMDVAFSRLLIFLGKVSMGIYLLHQIIFNIILKMTFGSISNPLIYGILLFVVTLGLTIILVMTVKRLFPKLYGILF